MWTYSILPAKFFLWDAKITLFLLVVLLHARLWTLMLLLVSFIFFFILEIKGFGFSAALQKFRFFLGGQKRRKIKRL